MNAWRWNRPSLAALTLAIAIAGCNDQTLGAPDAGPAAPAIPAQTGAQRLTIVQYGNAIHDLFGDDIAVPAALEPDTTLNGFVAIGSSASAISPRGVEQYEDAAFAIAAQAMASAVRQERILPCTPSGPADQSCAASFASTFGRRAWRRPLTSDEVTTISTITINAAGVLGDFYQGLSFGIAALIESPNFLYRPAVGEPDPIRPGKRRYTSYEMATRLAFYFWNSIPDEELLDAADQGLLTGDAGLAAQAMRMVSSPRAHTGLRNFVTEWLGLAALDELSKDPTLYTYFSPDLGPDAREETLRDFEHLVFDLDGDYRDIYTTNKTFVNPRLAAMYEVEAPSADGFAEITFPESSRRRGLLGHASILSLYAHPTTTSPTLRGKLVRTVLLCGFIPPPPVNVNTALPPPSAGAMTLRDRLLEVHEVDPFCASCHTLMDPIGLGLENFDSIGRYRLEDTGVVIDASGALDGAPFKDASGLARVVHDHPSLVPCFVKKMYEYSTSFIEAPAEQETLDALTWGFSASGNRVKSLMVDIAMSPAFRLASEPQ